MSGSLSLQVNDTRLYYLMHDLVASSCTSPSDRRRGAVHHRGYNLLGLLVNLA